MGIHDFLKKASIEEKDIKDYSGPGPIDPDRLIIPVEDLPAEEREEIRAELDRQKNDEESKKDIDSLDVKTVIGILPLEPVVVIVSLAEEKTLGDMKTIGIPGFINNSTGSFFLLDGSSPESLSLKEKMKEYIQNKNRD